MQKYLWVAIGGALGSLAQVLGWYNHRQPYGDQISLRHIRDQSHGVRDHRLLSGLPWPANGAGSSLEVPGSRGLCGRIQHVFHL